MPSVLATRAASNSYSHTAVALAAYELLKVNSSHMNMILIAEVQVQLQHVVLTTAANWHVTTAGDARLQSQAQTVPIKISNMMIRTEVYFDIVHGALYCVYCRMY